MRKRLLLLTGSPGSGKTTVLMKIAQALKVKGYAVGGMASQEVRSCGARIGFEIIDLSSLKKGWLAHASLKSGPQVGRYRVNMSGLEGLGVGAIVNAVDNSDVVVIDEIGPMELLSALFKEAVKKAIDSRKFVIGVVHWKARDSLITEVKARKDADLYAVTYENRDRIHEVILEKTLEFLENKAL